MEFPQTELLIYSIAAIVLLAAIFFLVRRSKKSPKSSSLLPLSRPREGLIAPLKNLFSGNAREIDALIPELEEILLSADVGVKMTTRLLEDLRASIVQSKDAIPFIQAEIQKALTPAKPFELPKNRPGVFFFVGINGVGKTTTIGKLASRWKKEGAKPIVVAGDTFRAAAQEQLKIWAERGGIEYIGSAPNSDPASVVFDGIAAAKARDCDLALIDTAGRLHTKSPLMEQLKKMVRIAERELGRNPDEIFLVLDATTGQNGLNQAKIFQEAVPVTGLILTKYDGTSKGGILLSVVAETGLPLRFVGVGEKVEDLKEFNPSEFVSALFQ